MRVFFNYRCNGSNGCRNDGVRNKPGSSDYVYISDKKIYSKETFQFEMGVTNNMYNNMDNDHTYESSS